jgi:glucokinase
MIAPQAERLILAGDVGGTKTRLGLFAAVDPRPALLHARSYPSRDAGDLEELIHDFLGYSPPRLLSVCFGIAGPIRHGECVTTNLPWFVSESNLRDHCGLERVRLINDLTATAYSIRVLEAGEMVVLSTGLPDPEGNVGLIAPGTGLGMALLFRKDGVLHPSPSEGGHADFSPRNELEMDLLRYLLRRMTHVSVERVASGPGLFTIYSWLRERTASPEPEWLTARIAAGDPPRAVSEAALEGSDPVCEEALELFVSIVAGAAGNLALTGMTTGGIYLGGGIFPKILWKLEQGTFLSSFTAKGRFAGLLANMPVRLILNQDAALLGAAHCAARMVG